MDTATSLRVWCRVEGLGFRVKNLAWGLKKWRDWDIGTSIPLNRQQDSGAGALV